MLITVMIFTILSFIVLVSIYGVLKDILAEVRRDRGWISSTADDGTQVIREVK